MTRSLPRVPHSDKTRHSVQTIDYITCLSVTLCKSQNCCTFCLIDDQTERKYDSQSVKTASVPQKLCITAADLWYL